MAVEKDGREKANGMHLAVIFDGSFAAWQRLHPTFQLGEIIEALLIYLNAHLAFSIANDVAVFDVDGVGATCVYHPTQPQAASLDFLGDDEDSAERKHMYRPFARLDETVIRHFKQKAESAQESGRTSSSHCVYAAKRLNVE